MDKYTVDLDQVLNDFEYSELTDQYSSSLARNAAASASSPIQNNVTKHSINNVFHSLNEYLNTNINVNSLNQIDNNFVENKQVLNVSQNHFRDDEESIKDCNLKTDELLVDFNQLNSRETEQNGVSILDSDDKFLEETRESSGGFIKIEDTGVEEETVEEFKGDTKEEVAKSEEKIEECTLTGEEINEKNKDVHNEEEEEGTEEEGKVEEVGGGEPPSDCKVTDSEIVKDFIEAEKKIGFGEDIDLDESEINTLLEQLENEELELNEESHTEPAVASCENESETKESRTSEPTFSSEETEHKPSDINDIKSENVEVIQDLEVTEKTPTVISDIKSDDIEESQSNLLVDIDDNLNLSEQEVEDVEEEKPLVTTDANLEEKIEVTDNTVESTGDNIVKTDEVEEIIDTNQETSINEAVVTENNSEIHKETSQDSLSRPQNLPLTMEIEEPKRKINLIGDPGSTPYNNVYINKEIPRNKNKEYDSDTDYSTSSSPTFSDASTTASTVSIDEVHAENGKNPVNPTVPKNCNESHVESEEISRTTSEGDNPTSTESPTSETADPTPEIDNPTSETENPIAEQAPPASQDEEASEGATDERFAAEEVASAGAQNMENIGEVNMNAISVGKQWLGKEAPLWIPDSDAMSCLHCDMKFTVLKRRHHCRACGLVLCSKCCHLRFRLEYLDAEARVCNKCHDILNKDTNSSSGSDLSPEQGYSPSYRPNPNNPLEYCSTVSPLQQAASSNPNPPAVMVPVGVLKRKGAAKTKSNKSVMFCDGIRPGSDLTNLDNDFDYNNTKTKKSDKPNIAPPKVNRNLPTVDPETNTFIPSSETSLPPTVNVCKTDISYAECPNDPTVIETLKNEQLSFAIHVNLYVHLKIINMSCCINKMAWCFSTEGLINVGQDEVVILLEYIDEESFVPKDVFYHINNVYNDAVKGNSVKEMGLSLHNTSNFLDSKNHAGFVYIRPTFQCLENVIKPKDPYLIGILIHRWETPWAKLFPLRLVLRFGAEYRYYPSPIISTRHRESVFVEIGHTIINLLADFRNFSYTLPQIRGLTIHMEDKNTTITIPVNRYDQVMKSMNNSSDHILAFAGNFSLAADSHLVCIQDTQGNENCYSTHAINIHNKPRKITGASFIVFNGALKSSSGLTAKSNIVEDGLMIQVLPEHMEQIRESLRAMKNHTVSCGCVNAASDETVNIIWGENDVNFNVGIVSAIDGMSLSGIPSIRVHNGKNHICVNGSRLIRWTEVFIIKSGDDNPKSQDPVDVSRVSESIAKATCDALVKYLDLLVANGCQKIGIRTTLHVDNVSYLAGSNGSKLAPIYMKSLDDELIPVLHRITTGNLGENAIVLELIFRILNV